MIQPAPLALMIVLSIGLYAQPQNSASTHQHIVVQDNLIDGKYIQS